MTLAQAIHRLAGGPGGEASLHALNDSLRITCNALQFSTRSLHAAAHAAPPPPPTPSLRDRHTCLGGPGSSCVRPLHTARYTIIGRCRPFGPPAGLEKGGNPHTLSPAHNHFLAVNF